jgi:hypothetical protein
MNLERILASIEHPHALGSFRNWIKLLKSADGIDGRYIPRVLFVCFSTLLTSPLRVYEELRYAHSLQAVEIHPNPVFIIGHWRTGTSHLHNLLCQDPNLGYISTFQAMAPGFYLVGDRFIRRILSAITRRVHPTRIIDNMPLSMDAPQEEDYALANMSPYSFLHQFTLPRQASTFIERYALFQELPPGELWKWTQAYLSILQKATYANQGKPLALKSPSNAGRLPELLDLFPEAKFIHLARNPYDVFLSMRNLYHTVLPLSQLQQVSGEQVDAYILRFYSQIMRKYLSEKHLIPKGNLIELKFEQVEDEPITVLRKIYAGLGIAGFAAAEPFFFAYLQTVKDYRKNQYTLEEAVIQTVNRHWQFALDEWGYERLK